MASCAHGVTHSGEKSNVKMCPDRIYRGVIHKQDNELFSRSELLLLFESLVIFKSFQLFYAIQTYADTTFHEQIKLQIIRSRVGHKAESVKTKHGACRILSRKTCWLRPLCLDVGEFTTVHSHGAQRCHDQAGRHKASHFQ